MEAGDVEGNYRAYLEAEGLARRAAAELRRFEEGIREDESDRDVLRVGYGLHLASVRATRAMDRAQDDLIAAVASAAKPRLVCDDCGARAGDVLILVPGFEWEHAHGRRFLAMPLGRINLDPEAH